MLLCVAATEADKGEYPGSNREHTVPQTVDLPIELYPPYVGVIRTLNSKYQKFMTYRLVYNILLYFKVEILGLDPKITICKIAVLPIKLYPPFLPSFFLTYKI